jgi:hypothetical protein
MSPEMVLHDTSTSELFFCDNFAHVGCMLGDAEYSSCPDADRYRLPSRNTRLDISVNIAQRIAR